MSASVLRLKRKASNEPIEGLVVALKKSKNEYSNEVYFKFAATLKTEKESIKDHIQAALSSAKDSKFSKWRDPKSTAVSQKNVNYICEKLKKVCKAASEKNKLDLLNNRRLIFAETFPIDDDEESAAENAEVRKLFQLYDIIEEENEEPKKQVDGLGSIITCNDVPLIREKASDYVFDVYIAEGKIDDSFVENTISLRPCTVTNDDIYSDNSDKNSETYDDEDDSNDENNWRNEYPEDEDSRSERDEDSDCYDRDIYCDEIGHSFNRARIADDGFDNNDDYFDYAQKLSPVQDDYADSD